MYRAHRFAAPEKIVDAATARRRRADRRFDGVLHVRARRAAPHAAPCDGKGARPVRSSRRSPPRARRERRRRPRRLDARSSTPRRSAPARRRAWSRARAKALATAGRSRPRRRARRRKSSGFDHGKSFQSTSRTDARRFGSGQRRDEAEWHPLSLVVGAPNATPSRTSRASRFVAVRLERRARSARGSAPGLTSGWDAARRRGTRAYFLCARVLGDVQTLRRSARGS